MRLISGGSIEEQNLLENCRRPFFDRPEKSSFIDTFVNRYTRTTCSNVRVTQLLSVVDRHDCRQRRQIKTPSIASNMSVAAVEPLTLSALKKSIFANVSRKLADHFFLSGPAVHVVPVLFRHLRSHQLRRLRHLGKWGLSLFFQHQMYFSRPTVKP